MVKICKICEVEKPISAYYSNGRYVRAECKPCTKLKQAAGRFGISVERLVKMYQEQDEKCAICKKPCSIYENLSIDHDHKCCPVNGRSCGKCVRGLLCAHCNHGIGEFKEDPKLLKNAVEYLAKYLDL